MRDLIKKGLRLDERKLDEFRNIEVTLNVSKNAEGSCMVKLGNTIVIAGIKMSIGEPYKDSPNKGILIVNSEFSPIASKDFEPGPPSARAIELARVVDRGLRHSEVIDFEKLCIQEGEKVWIVFVDIYILNDDGNLIDAAMLASLIALANSRFPKIEENGEINYEEHCNKLPMKHYPIAITVYKIANKLFVDATLKEIEEIDDALTIIVDEEDNIVGLQKLYSGGFELKEVDKAIDIAIKKAKEIREKLKNYLFPN